MGDVIVLSVLSAAVVLAVRSMQKQKAAGNGCCGCAGCTRNCAHRMEQSAGRMQ